MFDLAANLIEVCDYTISTSDSFLIDSQSRKQKQKQDILDRNKELK